MSPSTRSKPASETSPATGDAPDAKAEGTGGGKDESSPRGPTEIELEVSRQRTAGWTIFGLILGVLLIWKLGTVGVWVGVTLLVMGAFRVWELVQTFLHPPGKIIVTDKQVTLPRGLCMGKPIQVTPADVTAVYFLRRSVPWNRSAPVLVVEVGSRAMAYPRDWFASEADQRHVIHALMRNLGTTSSTEAAAALDDSKIALVQMIGGVVLLVVGITGWVLSKTPVASDSGHYALYLIPIVAGAVFAWRGFARW